MVRSRECLRRLSVTDHIARELCGGVIICSSDLLLVTWSGVTVDALWLHYNSYTVRHLKDTPGLSSHNYFFIRVIGVHKSCSCLTLPSGNHICLSVDFNQLNIGVPAVSQC
jgi:hypothetical protein